MMSSLYLFIFKIDSLNLIKSLFKIGAFIIDEDFLLKVRPIIDSCRVLIEKHNDPCEYLINK